MLVGGVQGRIEAKVDADAASHEHLTVERLSDLDRGLCVEEGGHDSAEGFEGRPGVYRRMLVDELAHLDEVGGVEDLGLYEVLVIISFAF